MNFKKISLLVLFASFLSMNEAFSSGDDTSSPQEGDQQKFPSVKQEKPEKTTSEKIGREVGRVVTKAEDEAKEMEKGYKDFIKKHKKDKKGK